MKHGKIEVIMTRGTALPQPPGTCQHSQGTTSWKVYLKGSEGGKTQQSSKTMSAKALLVRCRPALA